MLLFCLSKFGFQIIGSLFFFSEGSFSTLQFVGFFFSFIVHLNMFFLKLELRQQYIITFTEEFITSIKSLISVKMSFHFGGKPSLPNDIQSHTSRVPYFKVVASYISRNIRNAWQMMNIVTIPIKTLIVSFS